jgi:predicted transposase YdaD
LTAKWEARGEARGEVRGEVRGIAKGKVEANAERDVIERKKAVERIRRGLKKGMSIEDIADLTGYDAAEIEACKER